MTQIMCRAGCSTSIPGSNFTPHFGNHNRREAAADKIYHMIPSLFTFYCLLSQLAVRLISPCKMHICVSHIYLCFIHCFIFYCWANSSLSPAWFVVVIATGKLLSLVCLDFAQKIALQSFYSLLARSAGKGRWNSCQTAAKSSSLLKTSD